MPALRTGERGFERDDCHVQFPLLTAERYPAFAVDSIKRSGEVTRGSYSTTADLVGKSTLADLTPGVFSSALRTVMGHASQSMPGTDSSTRAVSAAKTGTASRKTVMNVASLMGSPSVEKGRIPGKRQKRNDESQQGPEDRPLAAAHPRVRAGLVRLASLGRAVELPVGCPKECKRGQHERGTEGLKCSERRHPGTAYPDRNEREGADAAKRCADGRERAADEGSAGVEVELHGNSDFELRS